MSKDPRVRILPDSLINKIAAGEVVERPASVVKELVENAVDAGAEAIRVDVRGGGKSLISVRDDGLGMGRDDALLAIERHATSKIRHPDDLFAIHTLGFRGEALPSIAQVSRMEIKTARRGDERGTHLIIHGGVLKAVKDAPPVPGTEIQVRRLFFNTPVRLRFMKGERTEQGHVTEAVVRAALARPDIRFELWKGDNPTIRAEATGDLERRVTDLLGRSVGEGMLPIDEVDGDLSLRGLASTPGLTRSSRNGLYLFVNGRPVRDRLLLGAVLSAYRGLLPRGRFPVLVLFLELAVGDVDHNVHPTKSEVRFVRSQRIYGFVSTSLAAALRSGGAGAAGGGAPPGGGAAPIPERRPRQNPRTPLQPRAPVGVHRGRRPPPSTSRPAGAWSGNPCSTDWTRQARSRPRRRRETSRGSSPRRPPLDRRPPSRSDSSGCSTSGPSRGPI